MSGGRVFGIPNHQLIVAGLLGIVSGLYIFKPFTEEQKRKKRMRLESTSAPATVISRDEQGVTKGLGVTSKNEL